MPEASIVIVTRNRKQVAEKAIASAVGQEGDVEVLLYDDASTDGTSEHVSARFPQVRVHRADRHEGYIVQRNRAARLARGRVLVSIDDDAVFTEPTIVRDVLTTFRQQPRVGAVAIPFVNQHRGVDLEILAPLPDCQRLWIRDTFVGTAYALRRDVFLHLGGFQEYLYHWAEEVEYCQRLLAAGYVVAGANSGYIRHFPAGVGKYSRQVNRYVHRNRLLVLWLNAPAAHALPMIAARTMQSLFHGARHPRELAGALEGLAMGYAALPRTWRTRRPLPREVYQLWLDLWRRRLTPFDEIESRLPPPVVPLEDEARPADFGPSPLS